MFENIFKLFKKEENSKDLAKERLKLVLIHDKANVSPEFLEMVKGEIIKVIKKYMEIDENSLDIQLTKTQSDAGNRVVPALVANIPILNVKTAAELNVKKAKAAEEAEEIEKTEKIEKTTVKKEEAEVVPEAEEKVVKKKTTTKTSEAKKTAKK